MKGIFVCNNPGNVPRAFGDGVIERLESLVTLDPTVYTYGDVMEKKVPFAGIQFIFSTWGMPSFSEKEIRDYFPDLQCVFYAAGTVQAFARPFLACGVRVFSAWAANAVPVAEYTVAQIILANKGYYRQAAFMKGKRPDKAKELVSCYPGNYCQRVGIIGAGMIGSLVAQMLQSYRLEVCVFDPYLSHERAKELGVELVTLKELFATCRVVSNHLANNAATRGMLNGELFAAMMPFGTFINTGRGAQVNELELAAALQQRPDLTAVLDVTDPEPPELNHPFYDLENCVLTPHVAGSIGFEVQRMGAYMAEECRAYLQGDELRYRVTLEMLETMA